MGETRPQRVGAQEEAYKIVTRYIDVARVDTLTRDEASDSLGYSWSNICDIYPEPDSTTCDVETAMGALEDAEFYVSVDTNDESLVIEVSVGKDVLDRHR